MRYIKRVSPTNIKAEFLDNDVVEFDLPNNILDISSFKFFYDAYVDAVEYYAADGSYLKRFMPRLSQSVIEEIMIYKDNVPLQQIKNFNMLFNILHDALKDTDEVDSNRINTLQYSTLDANNVCQKYNDFYNTDVASVINPLTYKYVAGDFLGFLQDVEYLDCRNTNIKISFKLAPKYITYRGLNYNGAGPATVEKTTENYHYKLSNVFSNIDCITPDEYVPTENNKIEFKEYKTITTKNDNNKNIRLFTKHKGSVNWVLSTFVDANRETDTGLQLQGVNADVATFGSVIVKEDTGLSGFPLGATSLAFEDSNNLDPTDAVADVIARLNTYTTSTKVEINQTYAFLNADNNLKINENDLSPDVIKNRNSENVLNNSIYFKRNGLNIYSAQYRLNGQDITPNMSVKEIYLNAKHFFKGMDRVKSLTSFQNEFFCFPMMLDIKDKKTVSELEWVVSADNKAPNGGKPIMFVCYDKSI